ncbi:hypothetical protein C2E23DRAFT_483578 [Lenzites betulinus]|nr:hypothetical protein C2E23DRAFT_483578 [Lenzites betulinus]
MTDSPEISGGSHSSPMSRAPARHSILCAFCEGTSSSRTTASMQLSQPPRAPSQCSKTLAAAPPRARGSPRAPQYVCSYVGRFHSQLNAVEQKLQYFLIL